MSNEATWRSKTDEEIYDAAKHLADYTGDGQRLIQDEMRRRGLMLTVPAQATRLPESSRSPAMSASEKAKRRYQDAYAVAGVVVGFGTGVKLLGMVVALAVAVLGFAAAKNLGTTVAMTGGVLGALAGAVIYMFGVLTAAVGQTQQATLDVAVNTSPFLDSAAKYGFLSGSGSDVVFSTTGTEGEARHTSQWRCSCGQTNPPSTNACLECGKAG